MGRWLRFDTSTMTHPKVLALSDAELRVWLKHLCHASEHGTDGLLSDAYLRGNQRGLFRLVSVGLVDEVPTEEGSDFYIHGFLEYQPSGMTSEASSGKARKAAEARWEKHRMLQASTEHCPAPMPRNETIRNKEKTLKRLSDLPSKSSPSPNEVLEGWNRIFGKSYTVKAWGGKLTACIRAHPEVTLAEHLEMIQREHATPWWKHDRPETPALQYGTVAQFERCIQRDTAPRLSPGDRVVQQLRAQRAQSEGTENGNV